MYNRAFYFISVPSHWRGTTLIELMLALTLSMLLLGLLSIVYLATEQANELRAGLLTLHDNSRFALQRLSSEFQLLGFIGCPRFMPEFPLSNATRHSFNSQNILELAQDSQGSTVVTVRHRGLRADSLQRPMTESSVLELSLGFQVVPGDIFLISDCRHAELFQVAQVIKWVGGQRLRSLTPLRYAYSENAELGLLEINTYAIERTGRKDDSGRVISALYVTDLRGRKRELVEGIERLRVEKLQLKPGVGGSGISIELEARHKKLRKTEYAFIALRN